MTITSPAFEHGALIPKRFTCEGDNVNPPLTFSSVPSDAQSLVLLMDDPDVPRHIREDGMWDHWVVFDIPASTSGVEEAAVPPGVVGLSTRNVNAYSGPCPPDREHRYFFRLYALDKELGLRAASTKTDIQRAMEGHIVAQAELMGRYKLTER